MIELIVAIAVIGVLAAIGFTQLNFGGFATRQAAQVLVSSLNQARLEAIRRNQVVGIEFVTSSVQSGNVRVWACADGVSDADGCSGVDAVEIRNLDFSQNDLARARLSSATVGGEVLAAAALYFDRRGVMRPPVGAAISITDRVGANLRTVNVLPTGRAVVE